MKKRLKTIAILTLAGIPAYIFCGVSHTCMCGHMQHGPYPFYHYLIDLFWATCFAAVLTFSIKLEAKRKMVFLIGSLFLIMLRIPLQGLAGGDLIFGLPFMLLLILYSIRYLRNPSACIKNENQKLDPARTTPGGSGDL
jgi:hypothetical protein